ncbi:MAG: homeodomain-containing protein [Amphiamblys sp. WSBS2006]|nr:MAG: homeodomain-containing protein [Amphiamblys sp. WSBS2006]
MFDQFYTEAEKSSRRAERGAKDPRRRKKTTDDQLDELERVFQVSEKPTSEVRKELGERLNMTPRCVQVWFQNRRAKKKKERGEYPKGLPRRERRIREQEHSIEKTGIPETAQPRGVSPCVDERLFEELRNVLFNGVVDEKDEDKWYDLAEHAISPEDKLEMSPTKINKILSSILTKEEGRRVCISEKENTEQQEKENTLGDTNTFPSFPFSETLTEARKTRTLSEPSLDVFAMDPRLDPNQDGEAFDRQDSSGFFVSF